MSMPYIWASDVNGSTQDFADHVPQPAVRHVAVQPGMPSHVVRVWLDLLWRCHNAGSGLRRDDSRWQRGDTTGAGDRLQCGGEVRHAHSDRPAGADGAQRIVDHNLLACSDLHDNVLASQ